MDGHPPERREAIAADILDDVPPTRARQRIVRFRRRYNQWVANQTLEDYALRFTAKQARRWSSFRVANTALGAISFLALEAIGGTITLTYGFTNATAAILVVGGLIFLMGLPISYYAARYSVDIDLLTRGAGFGYLGSTITSLIYASFTFIFFAIEASIMALALDMWFGLPIAGGYLVSSIVVIPLVTHGITFISRFQLWTQPLWIAFHLMPFAFIAYNGLAPMDGWTGFTGIFGPTDGSFDLILFGLASAVVFSLVAQIGEQVDFLRFLPQPRGRRGAGWWAAMLSAGPGWIVLGGCKLMAGSFLAYLALTHGVSYGRATEPTQMYLVAFQSISAPTDLAIGLTGAFVIVSQLKINVTNAYAGSIAWSNFFSRLTHNHPGRVVWLVFNVAIALLLMELGIYKALEHILGLYSVVAVAWVGALVADLVVNKPLGLSPKHIEFRRAHLYDINPVGVGAMGIASAISMLAFTGMFGTTLQSMASFLALAIAFVAAPLIAVATGGRYYIARPPEAEPHAGHQAKCCICENVFDTEDMARCPAYAGSICSLCCSLDARCDDLCKPNKRLADQAVGFLEAAFPPPIVERLNSRLGRYLGLHFMVAMTIAAILALIYLQATLNPDAPNDAIGQALWKVFGVLFIVSGVVAWFFVLTRESRAIALDESQRQNTLLMQEIEAHEKTDAELQKAKEAAEAANLAMSRYVTGISHELRTPLDAIFGYAQLLERDPSIPPHRHHAIGVIRRSSEHLADLIEGLLDISKIEAGRLNLQREQVHFTEFLDQLVDMFRLQAQAKGLAFDYHPAGNLPEFVCSDEKRLRQIMLNLLSNAIKFTETGRITFRVTYRNEVAKFEIEDTGIGIREEDRERIFRPFERAAAPSSRAVPGTGLGLTITQLLTEIMGGELHLESTPGKGSRFTVKLLLSSISQPCAAATMEAQIYGYVGRRLSVIICDDDPVHRAIIEEILRPIGFVVFNAPDGAACLELAREAAPDLILLDISMPGISGWEVARQLREEGFTETKIIMVSADASEGNRKPKPLDDHDAYVIKPVKMTELLARIHDLLRTDWIYEPVVDTPPLPAAAPAFPANQLPPAETLREMRELGRIGFIHGIHAKLTEIEGRYPECGPFVDHMRALIREFRIDDYLSILERVSPDDLP